MIFPSPEGTVRQVLLLSGIQLQAPCQSLEWTAEYGIILKKHKNINDWLGLVPFFGALFCDSVLF